ncbi:MAG: cobyrinate a,c-diamide synthase [Nitrospira sp.]|nr:cobyrinate a,c-diamide synthase [bacterium]MBL7050249.1 cobyrinate a,c-diamide synthase [Nitrospira sp.]
MHSNFIPRLVISGLRGGGGKTILSLSIAAQLKKRSLKVIPFKKGPDYIDAGWLARAAGSPCYNLDLFMMSPEQALGSFVEHAAGADAAIIEGNRGLFDGVDHKGTYSTAALAKLLHAPVILSIDCTKTTNTAAALVLGCQKMDLELNIAGVVLNRVATARQEAVIRKAIDVTCGIPVLGAIPRLQKDPFPERHMGLTPFQEHQGIAESIQTVEDIGGEYLDMDAIMAIMRGAEVRFEGSGGRGQDSFGQVNLSSGKGLRIGVIRDSAFQFYYQENIEALEARGAEIIEVSPLSEDSLPDIDALYIGGGFPETHAIALADNEGFRGSLMQAIEKGLPVYAECGGLMYLGESILLEGKTYPMVGVFPLRFGLEKKPRAHGYTVVKVTGENPFFPMGTVLKGHEFHYSRVLNDEEVDMEMAFENQRGRGIFDNKDGICYKNVLAGYTHLHATGSPEWVDGMIKSAEEYRGAKALRR